MAHTRFDLRTIRAALQALPPITPDPEWKARAKWRLMGWVTRMARRRWAICATRDEATAADFATRVIAAGPDWKPLVVDPIRLSTAMRTVEPEAVVVDEQGDSGLRVVEELRDEWKGRCLVLPRAGMPRLTHALTSAAA